ncbi:MAG: hypothetical protein FJ368_05610, partial [Pelagibacterales bacterium]|nr:hypothetical protein [Pelagibacterales bacterium]
MILNTQKKFLLVDEIINYLEANFTYEDYNGNQHYKEQRVKILLGRFGINYPDCSKFKTSYLLSAEDKNIYELAEYLLNDKGLSHLFHDKYAIEILAS